MLHIEQAKQDLLILLVGFRCQQAVLAVKGGWEEQECSSCRFECWLPEAAFTQNDLQQNRHLISRIHVASSADA